MTFIDVALCVAELRHVYWHHIVRGWTTSRLLTLHCAWLNYITFIDITLCVADLRHVYWRSIVRGWTTSRLLALHCAWLNYVTFVYVSVCMAEPVASWRRPPIPENDYKEVFNKQTKRCNDFLSEGWISSVDQKARRSADASSTPGCGRGPFSRVHFQCRLPYGARIPQWTVARISICVRILAAVVLFGHTKTCCSHCQEWAELLLWLL